MNRRRWTTGWRIVVVCAGAVAMDGFLAAQPGCSAQEQQRIASYVQRMFQAGYLGDLQEAMRLRAELQQSLSPGCSAAWEQSQAYVPQPGYGGAYPPQSPPSVYDHGGGTYSVPNAGACGPGGCIAY